MDDLSTVPNPTILHRRSSQEFGDRFSKRARASKPKVKSGCATCKLKRIKCDETKPICLRCQKLGRTCEGYPTTPAPYQGPKQIQPRLPSSIPYVPSVSINVTESESRYFQLFVEHGAKELSGYFDSEFWSHVALQESHEVPAIKHAIISLGALIRSLSMAPSPSLKVNILQTLEKNHHEQAALHYHKAIQLLKHYISDSSSPQLRVALITCILFVCFETIQGSCASTFQQIYSGLKLLRSYYRGRIPPQRNTAKSTACSGRNEPLAGNENVAVVDAQVKDYLESDAFHESPPISLSTLTTSHRDFTIRPNARSQPKYQTWQADLPYQPPTLMTHHSEHKPRARQNEHTDQDPSSNQKSLQFQFQVGSIEFTEPVSQIESAVFPSKRAPTDYSQQLSTEPLLGVSQRSIFPGTHDQEFAPTLQLSSNLLRNVGTEHRQYRSMSTVSLSGNSSAYSSDSGSYHEPSPYHLQPNRTTSLLRRSSLSTSFSRPEQKRTTPSSEIPSRQTSPTSASSTTPQPILQRTLEVEDSIIQIFVRLDTTGLFFGLPPGTPVLHWDIHHTFHLPIPDSFTSHGSAQHCWDFFMNRALQFYSTTIYNRLHKPSLQAHPTETARKHSKFVEDITAFQHAFNPLLTLASSLNTFHAPTLLTSLYTTSTLIILAQTTSPSEMTYDTFLPSFTAIVSTSSLLLTTPSPQQNTSRFSLSIGIIPPLHFTALKCRDRQVRRQAIELMFRCQRQEGLWDGILSGRIGTWVMGVEEEGMEGFDGMWEHDRDDFDFYASASMSEVVTVGNEHQPQNTNTNTNKKINQIVPLEKRIQLTAVSFNIPDRYITVKCQRVGGAKEVRETVIAW